MNAGNTWSAVRPCPRRLGLERHLDASNCNLELDANHTWRVRATIQNGRPADGHRAVVGTASFKSPVGGYIRGDELFDPLYNGRTVGQSPIGATFVPNQGLRLNGTTAASLTSCR